MSANVLTTTDLRCDLFRLERTNMVTKMEDRVKVDLVAFSKVIRNQLQQCEAGTLASSTEMLNRILVQFNQGALLQYQYGEIEKAETLCRGAIELFAELSSYSINRPLCLASMVTPYINLARIYGQKGEVRESLSIFEDVYRFATRKQDLSIFGHRLKIDDGPGMFAAASPGCHKVMLSCRTIESARVLQTTEDYPALLKLVEANESLPECRDAFFRQYLLEVRSRALLNLGQYDSALASFEECCRLMPANNTDRIVAHLLLTQIYRQWERHDLAAETLEKLEEYFAGIEHYGRKLPILRQIAYRLALERHLLGDNQKALAPAGKAFQWCSELSDQPGCIKTAILLLRLYSDESSDTYSPAMQQRWYNELRELAAATFFRLDRACAYWELGLAAGLIEADDEASRDVICEFLENSYNLYRSIPFVDSRQSCELVKRSLDSHACKYTARRSAVTETAWQKSGAIDANFDALMEYMPKSFVASQ